MSHYTDSYLRATRRTVDGLSIGDIENVVDLLEETREMGGRVYMLGVGGNAADCTHAVGDFRKLCGINAHAVTDNVSEVTANTNDVGWDSTFVNYLKVSQLDSLSDLVFVLSVGGGSRHTSPNILKALQYAKGLGVYIVGITGPKGNATSKYADVCVHVPVDDVDLTTPLTHSIQSVVLHLLFNHPRLRLA